MKGFELKLSILPDVLAVCRLDRAAPVPGWAMAGAFFSITRTEEEFSVVCPQAGVPEGIQREEGWRCLKVAGPLDFSVTGILASLTAPLAKEKISVFIISTYDTDYLLVKDQQLEDAVSVLKKNGCDVP